MKHDVSFVIVVSKIYWGAERYRGGTKVNFAQVPMDDDMEEVLIGSSGYTEQVFGTFCK